MAGDRTQVGLYACSVDCEARDISVIEQFLLAVMSWYR